MKNPHFCEHADCGKLWRWLITRRFGKRRPWTLRVCEAHAEIYQSAEDRHAVRDPHGRISLGPVVAMVRREPPKPINPPVNAGQTVRFSDTQGAKMAKTLDPSTPDQGHGMAVILRACESFRFRQEFHHV
jgi:hypothetical protein